MSWISYIKELFRNKTYNYSIEDRKRLNKLYKMKHSYEKKIKEINKEIKFIKDFY